LLGGGGAHTETTGEFVRFALHEQVHTVMLIAQLIIELVFEFLKGGIDMTRNCHRLALVLRCVDLDKVLQFVIIDIVLPMMSEIRFPPSPHNDLVVQLKTYIGPIEGQSALGEFFRTSFLRQIICFPKDAKGSCWFG
jgi:hypothetical protein